MPTMRHPDGAGPYEAAEGQVSHMRMAGWLTCDEWEQREGLPSWKTEPEPAEESQDKEPGESGEQETKRPRRLRPRATSEGTEG